MGTISRGIKNAFRNGIRTFSVILILSLSTGLALAMLLSLQTIQGKIDSVKSSIGNTINISPAGARGFEGGGEPLTDTEMAQVKSLPHIVKLTEALQDRLASSDTNLQSAIDLGTLGTRNFRFFSRNGQPTSPPISALGTNDPTTLNTLGGEAATLKSGTMIDGNSSANVALVGTDLAAKNNLTVGSNFQAYGQTVTVQGIFDSGSKFPNSAVVFPLKTLQTLSSQPGDISQAIAQVDSIDNLDTAAGEIKNSLGSAADVVTAQDTSNQALAPLESIKNISFYSLVGSLAAAAVIILLIMMMVVRERRREIGVLKAIGASNFRVVVQFVTEALVLTLLGTALGVAVGSIFSNSITQLLVANAAGTTTQGSLEGVRGAFRVLSANPRAIFNLTTTVDYHIILDGAIAAVAIAIVGSALPVYITAKIRPAEVLRSE